MFSFSKKSLNLLLILFIFFCLSGVSKKAHADPPPPPPDPVTIDPNPFDPYEKTDSWYTTTFSYYLYNDTLLWLRIYDLSDVLKQTLEIPPNGYTVDPVYGIAGGHSIVWDGSGTTVYGTYPYHMDDITFERATVDTGRQVYDVAVHPTNSSKLWMTDVYGGLYKLWQSTDGGNNWTEITGLYNSVGPHFGIAISSDGQRIYVLDNGSLSIHYSVDGGATWDYAGTKNLSLWTGANNPQDIACSSDGSVLYGVDKQTNRVYRGTVSCTGGDCTVTWNAGVRPLGTAADPTGVAVDPNNSNNILVADNGLVSGVYRVYRSTDSGLNFTTVLTDANNNPYQVSIDDNGHYWVSTNANSIVYQILPNPTFPDLTVMYVGGLAGNGNYQFKSGGGRLGIFVAQQYLYVASFNHYRIKIYAYENYESDNVFENEPDDPIVIAQKDFKKPGVLTLSAATAGSNSIRLSWTAPGDDYDDVPPENSKAVIYYLKYAKAPIDTEDKFNNATTITGVGSPKKVGTPEEHTKTDFESNTIYYFAIKAMDDMDNPGTGNLSDLSNTPLGKTGLLYYWNTVSCPLQPSPDNDPISVFGDDAGCEDPYCFWKWQSTWTGLGDPVGPDYNGYWEEVATIVPGEGNLLYSYKNYDPTDAAGTEITDPSKTIPLSAGWNLIGNPYGTSVSLSNCNVYNSGAPDPKTRTYANAVTAGWIGNAVYFWNGSTYDSILYTSAKLEPWKGYWIMAYYNLDLIIYNPNP